MGWLLIIKIDIRCSVKANNVEFEEKKKTQIKWIFTTDEEQCNAETLLIT